MVSQMTSGESTSGWWSKNAACTALANRFCFVKTATVPGGAGDMASIIGPNLCHASVRLSLRCASLIFQRSLP